MPPLVSSDSAVSDDSRRKRLKSVDGRPVAGHERRRVVGRVDAQRAPQLSAALAVLPGQLTQRHGRRIVEGRQQPPLARHQRLALKQRPQRVQLAPGLARERVAERAAATDGGVDLVPRVVILELDQHLPQPRDALQRGPGVGGHQEGEVRRALRRREPQPHRHVTVVGHDQGADEAERGDRLVELRVVDRPERFKDSGTEVHPTPTALSSEAGSSAGTFPRSSAGTSTPYSLAALRPRILRLPSMSSRGKSA